MHVQFAELPVINQLRATMFYTEHFDCQAATDKPTLQDNEDDRWLIGGQSR